MIHTTTLDYFAEYPIGMTSKPVRRRNVPMRISEITHFNEIQGNHFAWRLARQLEGREDSDVSEGIWPINGARCSKRFGWPLSCDYTRELPLADYSDKLYLDARKSRTFCYRRVLDAKEAQLVISAGLQFRFSCEITSDWYNPPNGRINFPPQYKDSLGSHAVGITQIDGAEKDRFRFTNSWGVQWGDDGRGSLSESAFDHFMIDAWARPLETLSFPLTSKAGL